uniref:Uncharacterized protein n=1 Tax=Oncorhynchus tshawytscha TaxID=74940 RepID=A0A8C8IET6_ONCTS
MKRMQSSRWLSRSVEDSSREWKRFILNDPSGEVGCSESTVSMSDGLGGCLSTVAALALDVDPTPT